MNKNFGLFMILVVVMGATALQDSNFVQPRNLQNIASWTGMYGLLTIGEAFVIITGGIDLSVGSIVGLIGCLLPMFLDAGVPIPLAILLVLLISAGIGVIHALLITKLKLQPFIVTLCGLFIYRGLARYITNDTTQGFGTGYEGLKFLAGGALPVLGVPIPFVLLIVVAILASIFLNRMRYGRYLFAVGNNETVARLSGIATDRVIGLAYILSATLAGLAGVLFALYINSVQPSGHGNFFELYAIAGAVLGGCSLRGGVGSILGVLIGTAIVRVLYNSINILGIATQLEFAVVGTVILIGVAADELLKSYYRGSG